MDRRRTTGSLSLLFLVALMSPVAGRAEEQDAPVEDTLEERFIEETSVGDTMVEAAHPGWHYPKAYAQRPLVMNKYMARGTLSVGARKVSAQSVQGVKQTLAALDFGAAFSPIDNLEVGISSFRVAGPQPIIGQAFFPIIVSPTGGFGDMPAYVRYSYLRRRYVEMAFDFVFVIPSQTRFATAIGFPFRIHVRPKFTIDTSAEVKLLVENVGANVVLPLKAIVNVTPSGFLFADSGFYFENLARDAVAELASPNSVGDTNVLFPIDKNQIFVPLEVGGGYTAVFKGKVVMDFFARFGWNPFVYLNAPSGVNVLPLKDTWFVGVGAVVQSRRVIDKIQKGDGG